MWALLACVGPAEPERVPGPLDDSWVADVVAEPGAFTAAVDTDRTGWIALHAHDLDTAVQSEGPAGARAKLQASALNQDLAALSALAWGETVAEWQRRGTLPNDSALPWFAALAAMERGDDAQVQALLQTAAESTDPTVAQAAAALREAGTLGALEPGDNPLLESAAEHAHARNTGDISALEHRIGQPQLRETAGQHTRVLYDPLVPGSLAMARVPSLELSGLDAVLFTDCLQADVCGLDALRALGLDPELGASDDAELARQLVRDLDAQLDPWVRDHSDAASDDGRALLLELQLAPQLRAELLLTLARDLLDRDRPRQALAVSQLSLDLQNPRSIGPVNAPGLFAVMARAQLQTGHTREALDALQILGEYAPQALGVDEIASDLAILKSLDRQGDSKEN
jgi:hypothetical protein